MAAWSRILLSKGQKLLRPNELLGKILPKNGERCMSDVRKMVIIPSRWQWDKTKDWFHFYTLVGVIPAGLIIFCANVFVGPATLSEIPEGYVPKHWEYYRSPITRFMAKHFFPNPQQEYEKVLHVMFVEDEVKKLRLLDQQYKDILAKKRDYNAYFYKGMYQRNVIADFRKRKEEGKL